MGPFSEFSVMGRACFGESEATDHGGCGSLVSWSKGSRERQ